MTMTLQEALGRLEALGEESIRARNRRLGAGDNQYGLRMGDIRKVAAEIKSDHTLGMALCETGNIDARLLAILLLKPKSLSAAEVDRLVRSVDFAQVADWLNSYVVSKHRDKESLRLGWLADDDPWAARAGWGLTNERLAKRPEGLDVGAILERIASEMGHASPEVQWPMNFCLIEIGTSFPEHRERAMEVGEALGLYRDWPVSKGCTSPFAPIAIRELVRRQG